MLAQVSPTIVLDTLPSLREFYQPDDLELAEE